MNIFHKVRNVFGRVLASKNQDTFMPDFSSQNFLEAMAGQGNLDSNPIIGDVVRHFRNRIAPTFFYDHEEIKRMVETVRIKYPTWSSRTLDRVISDREEGLDLYGISGACLQSGYPWEGPIHSPGQDVQYSFRAHRFFFLPRMAIATHTDSQIVGWIAEVLEDWIRYAESSSSKFSYGSSLLVFQRMMACSWAWLFIAIREETIENTKVESLLLKIIWVDTQFLAERIGQSYANNHLLADYFAGWFIRRIFPEFLNDKSALDNCEELWLTELERQTDKDGWSFELSCHYHEFACDMALAYFRLKQVNNEEVTENFLNTFRLMLKVQVELGGYAGVPLQIGDAIEDNFFPLGVHQGLGPGLYREAYRQLFNSRLPVSNPQLPAVEVAYWLLGSIDTQSYPAFSEQSLSSFPNAGLFFFRDDEKGVEFLFRTGPKRDVSVSAGHAHSDMMSIYFRVHGLPVLVDSGTFTYRASASRWVDDDPNWRKYFRGPESHNGLVLKGIDLLGDAHGDFRPKDLSVRVKSKLVAATIYCAWVEASPEEVSLYAGYKRGVVFIYGEYAMIYDVHPSSGLSGWTGFQFANTLEVNLEGSKTQVRSKDGSKIVSIVSSIFPSQVKLLKGSTSPLGGWVSEGYGTMCASPQVRFGFEGQETVSVYVIGFDSDFNGKVSVRESLDIIRITYLNNNIKDQLFLNLTNNQSQLELEGLCIDGVLCWIRRVNECLVEIRACNVSEIYLTEEFRCIFSQRETWIRLLFLGEEITVETASGTLATAEWLST